jgi:ketosteroid isomerase-like protein
MKRTSSLLAIAIIISASILLFSCSTTNDTAKNAKITEEIITIEKKALDRWGKGDPYGYLEIFADEVTYFNPFEESRIDSLPSMMKYYGDQAGQIFIDEFKMTDPKVQLHGDIAILTYNLFNYKKQPDGTLKQTTKWNSTKVYKYTNGNWRIIHNHWSFIQPEIKTSASLQD